MKTLDLPCAFRTPLDPVSAAFFWRSKAYTLLKVDLDPVFGDGPEGIGNCITLPGGGDAGQSCSFLGADVDDLDPDGPINQIVNPAGIVIEGSPNDSNVAIFEVKVDGFTDEQADELIYWEIESEGGSASFYPGSSDNKGKRVKVNGSSEGRVRLNVRIGSENGDPVVFTEALVVSKKTLPYRVNLLTYPNNPDEHLPNAFQTVPKMLQVANIIMRQSGIEMVPSSNNSIGNVDSVLGSSASNVNDLGSGVFYATAKESNQAISVFGIEQANALSINYVSDLLQLSFVESVSGAIARNPYRPQSSLPGSTYSEAYKTSSKDIFDEDIQHTLNFLGANNHPNYPGLYGALIGWRVMDDPNIQKGGWYIAHESGHALNLEHRAGYTTGHNDGLGQQYLGPAGTNLMDYGNGVDIDIIQIRILRASPLLQ